MVKRVLFALILVGFFVFAAPMEREGSASPMERDVGDSPYFPGLNDPSYSPTSPSISSSPGKGVNQIAPFATYFFTFSRYVCREF